MKNHNTISRQILETHPKVLIVGDLAIDYIISAEKLTGNVNLTRPEPQVGGCAYNAALGFRRQGTGILPVICASVGNDVLGRLILDKLRQEGLLFAGFVSEKAMTGFITIIYLGEDRRTLINDGNDSANDYDIHTLEKAISACHIGKEDYVLFLAYAVARFGISHCMRLMEVITATGATVAVDMVPHNLFQLSDPVSHRKISLENINSLFCCANIIITEYNTLCGFMGQKPTPGVGTLCELSEEDITLLCGAFPGEYFALRYGLGEISRELICKRPLSSTRYEILEINKTGYEFLPKERRRGFGDILTAQLIAKHASNSFSRHI
jgi:sugar/nucleoside kinase (ribokinase family)